MSKIAVVILNWNGRNLLEKFLPSVVKYSSDAVIYVADNASTDDSIAFLQANYPGIKIIRNNSNSGYAKGYNDALQFVEEETYALVNSDIEVTENWLAPISRMFADEPETAIIQPKILDYKNKDYFEYAGAGGGFIDKYGFPYCRGRIFGTLEKDNGQFDDEAEIFWASGACFFIRKKVFWELQGFDADFFAHQEEIDLCWRAFNRGHMVKYCGKSTVYHVGGATLKVQNPKKTYLNFRNSLFMMVKNVPGKSLFPTLFIRLSLDGMAGMHFLAQGKPDHLWAVLKSHVAFYWFLVRNYRKRSIVSKKKYYNVRSIVRGYFLKKKHHYKDFF